MAATESIKKGATKLFCEQKTSQSKGTRVSIGAPQVEDSNTIPNHISASWVEALTVLLLQFAGL